MHASLLPPWLFCPPLNPPFTLASLSLYHPLQYAFVIHTTNPTNGDEGEIYVELVKGLGEAIVSGTVPGAALTFTARKDDMSNPTVLLYPSKGEGMFVPESLIFRSDSNGEDLQGYAGAGEGSRRQGCRVLGWRVQAVGLACQGACVQPDGGDAFGCLGSVAFEAQHAAGLHPASCTARLVCLNVLYRTAHPSYRGCTITVPQACTTLSPPPPLSAARSTTPPTRCSQTRPSASAS